MAVLLTSPIHKGTDGSSDASIFRREISYNLQEEKTVQWRSVSCYGTSLSTCPTDFALSHERLLAKTGRDENDASRILGYRSIQSFVPGEIGGEAANAVGYELASRFLQGDFAFVVATHQEQRHVHNHIIWNAVDLRGQDFFSCSRYILRIWEINKAVCRAHGLHVIEEPTGVGVPYAAWLAGRHKTTQRDLLRSAIDQALCTHPKDLDELLRQLEERGYRVWSENPLSVERDGHSPIRFASLGDNYTCDALCDIFTGARHHIPVQKETHMAVYNVSRGAIETVAQLPNDAPETGPDPALEAETERVRLVLLEQEQALAKAQKIAPYIEIYYDTKDAYDQFRAADFRVDFKTSHPALQVDITRHRAARKALLEAGVRKLPTRSAMHAELEKLEDTVYDLRDRYRQLDEQREKARDAAREREKHKERTQEK